MLFGPDEYVSYSNGGMIVAGRLLEVVTGMSYHDLLADAIAAIQQKARDLLAQADAFRELSSTLGHDDA